MGSKASAYTGSTWINNWKIWTQTVQIGRLFQLSTFSHSRIIIYIPYWSINRYYLEPATPLQSIANTVQLVTPSAKPQPSDIASLTNGMAELSIFFIRRQLYSSIDHVMTSLEYSLNATANRPTKYFVHWIGCCANWHGHIRQLNYPTELISNDIR